MSCRGLHCGGCGSHGSSGGHGRLVVLLVGGLVALPVLYRGAGAALAGVSASAAQANRLVGVAVAVVLVVAAVTGCGWLLLARRRQVREAPVVAAFSAQVQTALDARRPAGPRPIAPGPTRPPMEQVTVYRLDQGPTGQGVRSW